MQTIISHSTMIRCNIMDLFGYITKPWLWHEWQPHSLCQIPPQELRIGDQFCENITITPFRTFPIKVSQNPIYEVMEIYPNQKWVLKGKFQNSDIQISYEFKPITNTKTKFIKTMTVNTKGSETVLHPLLHLYLQHRSNKSISQLKQTCERRF